MNIQQLYTSCLAQGAYFIESNEEVAIIDPLREVDQYIEMANEKGSKIKYIFETHFHADFVSGHITLSKKTGAPIIYGPLANPDFDVHVAKDGEEFKLGELTIKVLHTPGHTMESTCYLLKNAEGKDHAIFTGDTLFLGDVGRPDLAQKNGELTANDLAGYLYDSLRDKIIPLADDVIVYPAHGAGSACGKNMMSVTVDSLGNQKKMNYALDENLSKEDFITQLLDGLAPPPAYFPLNVQMNKGGYKDIDAVIQTGLTRLEPEDIKELIQQDVLLLDVRSKEAFAKAHIPGSLFIGLDGSFAPWVGSVIKDVKQEIVLIAPKGREEEAVTRLARVGFDHVKGYVNGGISAWVKSGNSVSSVNSISPIKFIEDNSTKLVFDVRNKSEFDNGHVENSSLTPLAELDDFLLDYQNNSEKYVYCRSGYRSLVAISMLKRKGVKNLINVNGGYSALEPSVECSLAK